MLLTQISLYGIAFYCVFKELLSAIHVYREKVLPSLTLDCNTIFRQIEIKEQFLLIPKPFEAALLLKLNAMAFEELPYFTFQITLGADRASRTKQVVVGCLPELTMIRANNTNLCRVILILYL